MTALEAVEVRQTQGLHNLTGSVRTEIEHQNAVPVLHDGVAQSQRFEKFVCDSCGVAGLQQVPWTLVGQRKCRIGVEVVGLLRALPTFVPIHGPVATTQGCQFAHPRFSKRRFNGMDIAPGALRRGVSSIGHGMDRQLADAHSCGPADQSAEMVNMAVNAAIGAESQQVQGAIAVHQTFCEVLKNLGGLELVLADGVADPHQLLANDPTCTDGEVPHLGVAHLLIRQPHMGPTGLDQRVRVGVPESFHHRRVALADGVVL